MSEHSPKLSPNSEDEQRLIRLFRCLDHDARSEAWPAAGFKDTELGVSMKLEVSHGATQVYARVQS